MLPNQLARIAPGGRGRKPFLGWLSGAHGVRQSNKSGGRMQEQAEGFQISDFRFKIVYPTKKSRVPKDLSLPILNLKS
jgi:hypothetical protein